MNKIVTQTHAVVHLNRDNGPTQPLQNSNFRVLSCLTINVTF